MVQTLLYEEGFEVCSDMLEYRKNLSRRMLELLPTLENQPVDVGSFYASFKAGWQQWKKKGLQNEKSSFEKFMDALSGELDRPIRSKTRMDKEPETFSYFMVFLLSLFFNEDVLY